MEHSIRTTLTGIGRKNTLIKSAQGWNAADFDDLIEGVVGGLRDGAGDRPNGIVKEHGCK